MLKLYGCIAITKAFFGLNKVIQITENSLKAWIEVIRGVEVKIVFYKLDNHLADFRFLNLLVASI